MSRHTFLYRFPPFIEEKQKKLADYVKNLRIMQKVLLLERYSVKILQTERVYRKTEFPKK